MPSESLRADNATLESQFFDALNRVAEPAVRAGFGSPGLTPTGLIVLETTGRRSGLSHRVPVIGTLVGGHVVVGTVRVGRVAVAAECLARSERPVLVAWSTASGARGSDQAERRDARHR